MPKRPDLKELESCTKGEYKYDLAQASRVLEAMDLLRKEAVSTRIPEIVTMIDAAHRILVTTYCSILRYEMTKLPATEDVAGEGRPGAGDRRCQGGGAALKIRSAAPPAPALRSAPHIETRRYTTP